MTLFNRGVKNANQLPYWQQPFNAQWREGREGGIRDFLDILKEGCRNPTSSSFDCVAKIWKESNVKYQVNNLIIIIITQQNPLKMSLHSDQKKPNKKTKNHILFKIVFVI